MISRTIARSPDTPPSARLRRPTLRRSLRSNPNRKAAIVSERNGGDRTWKGRREPLEHLPCPQPTPAHHSPAADRKHEHEFRSRAPPPDNTDVKKESRPRDRRPARARIGCRRPAKPLAER